MNKIIVLTCVIVAALGAHVSKESPKFTITQIDKQIHSKTLRKIVGGVEIDIEQAPYQVALEQNGKFSCGGSIANSNHIITAAHCTEGVDPQHLTIRAGSTTHADGGVLVQVAEISVHEDYSFHNYDYDVSVLTLAENLTYDNTIQPIGLTEVEPTSGDTASVTGWGTLKEGDTEVTDNLRYAEVSIIDRETCNNDYGGRITSRMICAGLEEGGKGSCQGDSGGPLVVNGVLAGIISWSNGCAKPGYPGVYANINNFKRWIEIHL